MRSAQLYCLPMIYGPRQKSRPAIVSAASGLTAVFFVFLAYALPAWIFPPPSHLREPEFSPAMPYAVVLLVLAVPLSLLATGTGIGAVVQIIRREQIGLVPACVGLLSGGTLFALAAWVIWIST
jgi:hypothetical protein